MTAARRFAVPAFLALALLVTGCSAPAGAGSTPAPQSPSASAAASGDQSKADACKIVQEALFELGSLSSVDSSDPKGALKALKGAQGKLDDAATRITHADIKPAADGAADAIGDYVTFFETLLDDPAKADVKKVAKKVETFKDSLLAFGAACA